MLLKTKVLPLALALAFAGHARRAEIIKIGHVAPVSGASSHERQDSKRGQDGHRGLERQRLQDRRQVVKFVLLPEDDAADPKQGTAVAQKLVDAEVNGVIGHLNSGTTIPASRIYFNAGIH